MWTILPHARWTDLPRACLDPLAELGLPDDQVHYDVINE